MFQENSKNHEKAVILENFDFNYKIFQNVCFIAF